MSSNIFVNRVCQWCGKEFVARTTTTNYCSHRCSGLAYKERKRQAKLEKVQEEFERVKGCPPELEKQEFLTPRQAARVIGICYKTIYNYINNGSLKTWKLCRKTLIRRADIDALFSTSSERPVVISEKKPISEFYTTQEILEKFGISNSGFYKILKTEKFPKTIYRGKSMWSREHVDRYFAKKAPSPEITEWYSVEEMQRKFGMTVSAVYCFISEEGIPKMKIGRETLYSKTHVEAAKGLIKKEEPQYYTYAEAMEKYGMTHDQMHHYVKYHNILRVKKGRYTYISRKELDDLLAPPTI